MYNQESLIEMILKGICNNTTTPFNIILVFDGCTDNTMNLALDYLKRHRPQNLREIRTATAPNVYETKANNIGFRLTTSPCMLTLQDDMVIREKGWERRLTFPLRCFDDIFAVTSRTAQNIFYNNSDPTAIFNDVAAREDFSLARNCFAIRNTVNRGPVAFRTDILKKLNFLDEAFAPADFDEADLVLRAFEQYGMKCGAFWIDYVSEMNWSRKRKGGSTMVTRNSFAKSAKLLMDKHPQLKSRSSAIIEQRIVKDSEIDYISRDSGVKRMALWIDSNWRFAKWRLGRKWNGLRVRLSSRQSQKKLR
jgi:glycosyltransferase involved in cell wall biosynthesis